MRGMRVTSLVRCVGRKYCPAWMRGAHMTKYVIHFNRMTTKLERKNFDMSHLNAKEKSIAEVFVKIAKEISENPSDGGCKAFYKASEWRARGEDYGTDSELVVVYDGGDLYSICNTTAGCPSFDDSLQEELFKKGYFFEQCTTWYGAVYKS